MNKMKPASRIVPGRLVWGLAGAAALSLVVVAAPDSWSQGRPVEKRGDKADGSKPKPRPVPILTESDPPYEPCTKKQPKDQVSRWAKWDFITSPYRFEVNLDIPYRDEKGFIGEITEKENKPANSATWVPTNKHTRVDNISYDPTSGKLEFRESRSYGKARWFVGCVNPPPAPVAWSWGQDPGKPWIEGRVSKDMDVNAAKPGMSVFGSANQFYTFAGSAQYNPVTPPVDIFPLETPGALVDPTPRRTIALKVCASGQGLTEEVVDVTGFNGRMSGDVHGSCADPKSPSTCIVNLQDKSDFFTNWGAYVSHGGDTPGCDQVLFQVFQCFLPIERRSIRLLGSSNPSKAAPGTGGSTTGSPDYSVVAEGSGETRYARIDLRAPLPYTVKLSCGSDYIVPEGIDPAQTSDWSKALEPARRAFQKKAADIVRSRSIAENRLEAEATRLDSMGGQDSFPATLEGLKARYLHLATLVTTGFSQDLADAVAAKVPLVGDVVPMDLVYKRIQKLVELGRLPAAEKKDMKSIETFDCPADPAAARSCVFPVHQYQALLPEIARFFKMMMARTIYEKCAKDWACDKDPNRLNAWWYPENERQTKLNEIPANERDPDFQSVVGGQYDPTFRIVQGTQTYLMMGGKFIYNFGCKLLSKYLPGMTKVEKIKIVPKGINVMGNWDEEITDKAALAKELGKPAAGAGSAGTVAPYEPPPREEVIEVCTVTHPHLELQLKVDLGLLAYILSAERKRQLDVDANDKSSIVDNDPFAAEAQEFELSPQRRGVDHTTVDDKKDPRVHEETYQTIADRLMGFYRKGGKARLFSDTHQNEKDELVTVDTTKLPPQIDGPGGANLNASMPKQNEREDLRRQVDQWSDAWEYNRMRVYIGRKIDVNAGYAAAQKKLVGRMLRDCGDLWEVCKHPKFDVEIKACKRCAFETIAKHCVGGRSDRDGSCLDPVTTEWVDPSWGLLCTSRTDDEISKCATPPSYKGTTMAFGGPWTYVAINNGHDSTAAPPRLPGFAGNVFRGALLGVPLNKDFLASQGLPEGSVGTRPGNTLLNWFASKLWAESRRVCHYDGTTRNDPDVLFLKISEAVALHWFFPYALELASPMSNEEVGTWLNRPAGEGDDAAWEWSWGKTTLSGVGLRYLQQAPLTRWQMCFLWTGSVSETLPLACEFQRLPWEKDSPVGVVRRLLDVRARAGLTPWSETPLFRAAKAYVDLGGSLIKSPADCGHKGGDPANLSRILNQIGYRLTPQPTSSGDEHGAKAGDVVMGALGPIIGKIVSLLIKGDIEQVMKVLAKAAGMTPEQALDCEDAEYRHETMKLGAKSQCGGDECNPAGESGECRVNACKLDNKRGCLTKVFAKNFVDMLESIIVMIGNKLVDWGVDQIRGAVEGIKYSISGVIRGIPFVGSVLSLVFDKLWDFLIDFGMKTLLKGLVVQNLPSWLKIRELAGENLDKLIEKHPIISLVAGIILDLITQALAMGDKGPVEVGFASALNLVQGFLEKNAAQNAFWIRAIIFAKKELLHQKGSENFGEQAKAVLSAIITGFFKAIEQRVDSEEGRRMLAFALDNIKKFIAGFDIATFGQQLMSGNPIEYIMKEILAKQIIPAAIPIVTAFVEMPKWAKTILIVLGNAVRKAVDGSTTGADAIRSLVKELLRTTMVGLTEQIPDAGLRDYVSGVWNNVLTILDSDGINTFKAKFCIGGNCSNLNATAIVGALKDLVQELVPVLMDATMGSGTSPVKSLLSSLFTRGFSLLGGNPPTDADGMYQALFCTAAPGGEMLAQSITRFIADQLSSLTQGTGLQQPITDSLAVLTSGLCGSGPGEFNATTFGQIVRASVTQLISAAGGSPLNVALANALVDVAEKILAWVQGSSPTVADAGALITTLTGTALDTVRTKLVDAVKARLGDPVGVAFEGVVNSLVSKFPLITTGLDADSWTAFRTPANLANLRVMATATLGDLVTATQITAMTFERASEVIGAISKTLTAALGDGPLARAISDVISGLVVYVNEPSRFPSAASTSTADVENAAAAKVAVIAEGARQLVAGARGALFDGTDPKGTLFYYGLLAMVNIAETKLTSSGDVAAVAKEQAIGLAGEFAVLLRGRIAALVPERLGSLQGLLLDGFDALSDFAVSILKDGYVPAKAAFMGNFANLPKKVVSALFQAAEDLVSQAISHRPLRVFVTGLMETLSHALNSATWPPNAAALLTDFSTNRLKPFIYDTLGVDTTAAGVVKKNVVDFGFGILFGALEGNLAERITQLTGGNYTTFVKGALAGVLTNFANELKSRKSLTLGRIVDCAAEFLGTGNTPTACLTR